MVIRIPYNIVVFLLGEKLAPYFNEICATITFIGFFFFLLKPKKQKIVKKTKKDTRSIYIDAEDGAKSPTGWTYDRDTLKWNPPEYLVEESARKWRWDEEKQIWIDQDKEAHLHRYQEYWKDKRTEPTYEEWKAAKLAEEKAMSAPAPGPAGAEEPEAEK